MNQASQEIDAEVSAVLHALPYRLVAELRLQHGAAYAHQRCSVVTLRNGRPFQLPVVAVPERQLRGECCICCTAPICE